jgi:hypothetical protein
MTRSESKQAMLDALGAVPVVADALDPDQVAEATGRARPEVSCGAYQVPSGSRRRASGAGAASTPAL